MLRLVLILLLLSTSVVAEEPLGEYGPLGGVYDLIGRKPDSNETYTGTIKLIPVPSGLRVERKVGGVTVIGSGRFELKTPDKIQVLTITFRDNQAAFESSCRISWDLDNYARFTCLYGIVGKTQLPGMEAFFIQRESS